MIPTNFSALVGNEAIKRYLSHIIQTGAIGNSLLFVGPDGVGKGLFAQAFAAQLMDRHISEGIHSYKIARGQHPDIHVYRPEGKLGMHGIQSLRQLNDEVHLPPYEADWKVFIIHDAERMLPTSANALLKTFEEPPPRTLIILLSQSKSALLPTIISRCRVLPFQAISVEDIELFLSHHYQLEPPRLRSIAHLAQGSIGRAIQLAQHKEETSRNLLFAILSQGKFSSYRALTEAVGRLSDQIEVSRKQAEEAAKEEGQRLFSEASSAQQHSLEKELEGLSTMAFVQETQSLFYQLLSWYRDLHLLHLGGKREYLLNPDFGQELEQALQRGNLLSIERAHKAIEEAQLALQRSTSLTICLENLFLKLGQL